MSITTIYSRTPLVNEIEWKELRNPNNRIVETKESKKIENKISKVRERLIRTNENKKIIIVYFNWIIEILKM